MGKKANADVDEILAGVEENEPDAEGEGESEAPVAKKTKKPKAAKPAVAAKKATKAVAKVPAKKSNKAATVAKKTRADSQVDEIRAYLAKVKKKTDYQTVANALGADTRAVRRTARAMRDAGALTLTKDGQKVVISPAV